MAQAKKTTKTTAAKTKPAAKTVVSEEVKTTAPVTEKKAEEKVSSAKVPVKAATKTASKASAKAAVAKTETKVTEDSSVEVKTDLFVEFGNAQVSMDKVVEDVKKTFAAQGNKDEVKSVKVYLKPEEQTAYYIVNGTVSGKMDVFFF